MIASVTGVIDVIINNDHIALKENLIALDSGFDIVTVTDVNGIVLARSYNDIKGDSIISQYALSSALRTGTSVSSARVGLVFQTHRLSCKRNPEMFNNILLCLQYNLRYDMIKLSNDR